MTEEQVLPARLVENIISSDWCQNLPHAVTERPLTVLSDIALLQASSPDAFASVWTTNIHQAAGHDGGNDIYPILDHHGSGYDTRMPAL